MSRAVLLAGLLPLMGQASARASDRTSGTDSDSISSMHVAARMRSTKPGYHDARSYFPRSQGGFDALCVVASPEQYAGYMPGRSLDPGKAAGAAKALSRVLHGENCGAPKYKFFCADTYDRVYRACGAERIGEMIFLEGESCDDCRRRAR